MRGGQSPVKQQFARQKNNEPRIHVNPHSGQPMHNRALWRKSLLSLAAGGLFASSAMAEEPPLRVAQAGDPPAQAEPAANPSFRGVEEVIVTAQKREESLQDVPIAVSAMGPEQLESLGITSLSKLVDTAMPGLTVLPFAGSPTALMFNIRGVSVTDPTAGLADPGVAIYSDGIVMSRAFGTGLELVDLERVEILRGPQGTLFGRNAEGGAVQYISKRPTGSFGGRIEAQAGNYGQQRLLAHLDLEKVGDFSIKLSGLTTRHKGYTENKDPGPLDTASENHDFLESQQSGGRIAVLWEPSDQFDASYAYDRSSAEYTGGYVYRTGGRTPSEPVFCRNPNFESLCADDDLEAANTYQGTQQPQEGFVDRSSVAQWVKPNTDEVDGHALILNWEASDNIQLKSLTGYRELSSALAGNQGPALAFVQFVPTSLFDGVGSDVPAGTVSAVAGSISTGELDQHQFSQELQLVGSRERFEYTAGLYYFNEEITDLRATDFALAYTYLGEPGVLTPIAVDPFPLSVAENGQNASLQVYDASAESYAAYAQGTYNPAILDDRLKLTLGLRYNNDEKDHTRVVFGGLPDNEKAPTFSESRVDPAVTIAYDLSESVNSYLRYATGYRAGGTSIRNRAALTVYKPEEIESWELGLKSELLDRTLRWNAAAYTMDISDYQASLQNVPGDASSTDIFSVDGISISGIENELTWAPIRALRTNLSYAYQYVDAPDEIPGPNDQIYGFRYPMTPKHAIGLGVDAYIPMGSMELVPHIDYASQSDYYSSAGTPPRTDNEASSLNTVNARLSLQNIAIGQQTLSVALWSRNLTNEDNYLFAYSAPTNDFTVADQPGGAAQVVNPRTYGVDLRYEF